MFNQEPVVYLPTFDGILQHMRVNVHHHCTERCKLEIVSPQVSNLLIKHRTNFYSLLKVLSGFSFFLKKRGQDAKF